MKLRVTKIITILAVFLTIVSASGVYATWYYTHGANPGNGEIQTGLNDFYYGPPETIYISKVEIVSNSSNITNLVQTPSLPTKLIVSAKIGASNSSITYKITVHNNTDITYWYLGIRPEPAIPSNSLLGISGGISITTKDKLQDSGYTFDTKDWVPPRTERDFYATYIFGNLAIGDITTMVDFRFGVQMDSVYDGFLKILNDKISNSGYNYLAQVFNDKYAQTGSDVIANVGEEKEIFNNLFGGDLYVDVNGVKTPVTVMVQRKDVDGTANGDSYSGSGAPSGCEYSLYISIPSQNEGDKATVYAVSYTCKNTGEDAGTWYQIGQLYEGTANVSDYGGVEDGAFDANSWKASPKEYNLGNGLVYKVGYQQGNHFEIMKSLSELMSARDSEFGNKINGNQLFKNVYNIVKANPNSQDPAIVNLRNAWNDIEPYFVIYNNGGTIWYDSNKWTRSEILPYIVHLADAYDYYLQVHG
ncbi:MAG: hypothetical protein IKJ19_04180 [Clostridia bacterium]|nr:hypothetical protein [Clostridia bacterium]